MRFIPHYCRLLDSSSLTRAPQSAKHLRISVSAIVMTGEQILDAPLSMTRVSVGILGPESTGENVNHTAPCTACWSNCWRRKTAHFFHSFTLNPPNSTFLGSSDMDFLYLPMAKIISAISPQIHIDNENPGMSQRNIGALVSQCFNFLIGTLHLIAFAYKCLEMLKCGLRPNPIQFPAPM